MEVFNVLKDKLAKTKVELTRALEKKPFDQALAIQVSDDLHELELAGLELSRIVERKWERLTNMIELSKMMKG